MIDVETLNTYTDQELQELLNQLQALDEIRAADPIAAFRPYAKQAEFLRLGAVKRERLFMAGNRCVSYDTLIDHPDGTTTPAGVLFDRGEPFKVLAWDGHKLVSAFVSHVIRKPPEQMVRIELKSGRWFECTLNHRVLTRDGWHFVHEILSNAADPLVSSSGNVLPIHNEDGQRSRQTVEDYRDHYSQDHRPCDARPLSGLADDRDVGSLQADVLQYSHSSVHSDDQASIPASNHLYPQHALQSVAIQCVDPNAVYVNLIAYMSARYTTDSQLIVEPSLAASISELQSNPLQHSDQYKVDDLSFFNSAGNSDDLDIYRVDVITSRDVYDFNVPIYHNYFSGVIHHNCGKTETGCLEVAAHLTGRYPPWWEGRRFNTPPIGWACGASGASVRDVLQPKLFGYPTDTVTMGFIPKDLIEGKPVPSHGVGGQYDLVRVKHISGGVSQLALKSYEQNVEKWMGAAIDFCLVDEEPPMPHYDEALARLKPRGVMLVTFTPLGGLTDLLCRFLREPDQKALQHRSVTQMSLHEAEHFTEDERQQRIAGYSQHMREARTFGTPALGSGVVFTTPVSQIQIDSEMDIPTHWTKIWGMDFGIAHPFAAVLIAWDRETDTMYVLHCIRMENARPTEHVAAMKRIAPSVPVAWPHDGSSREKSTGETLISSYRQAGLTVLPHHATWIDGSNSTEAGVLEMEERFNDGRLRVKSNCQDFFDEYRGYHRDKTGNLVKVRDDLISALRIAVMMRRYSRPGPIEGLGRKKPMTYRRQGFI